MTNKQPKILYLLLFPFYGSGSGTYARYLGRQVGKKYSVAIVAPDKRQINKVKNYPLKTSFKAAFTGHPEWEGCKLFADFTKNDTDVFYNDLLNSVESAIKDFKPDIIHVHHGFMPSWVSEKIKEKYQIPYVVTIHGSELPTIEKNKLFYKKTKSSLEMSERIFPNSSFTKKWTEEVFGEVLDKKMTVIPGGVDMDKFHKVDTKKIDQELGTENKKVALFSGKLTRYKGVEYLVEAAKKIKGEVFILGDGPERKSLEKIAKTKDIKNIKFLGHIKDDLQKLIEIYSRADALVVPSIWEEPLGLVILEAMACETPVVATKKGGIPSAVKDGVNGLFIKSKDSENIAEKVNHLFENPTFAKNLSKGARKTVSEKFSWTSISRGFIFWYEQILARENK